VVELAANRISFSAQICRLAIPELLEALHHPDRNVRMNAAQAMRQAEDAQTIPALMAGLEDQDEGVSAICAQGLQRLGPAAKESVPALLKALKRKDRAALSAAGALGKIGGSDVAVAVPDLILLFEQARDTDKLLLAQSLGEIGPPAAKAVPALLAVLDDERTDEFLKTGVIQALGRIGSGATAAEGRLQAIVMENSVMTRDFAIHALRLIRQSKAAEVGDGD
jgi:HEAT repeat protein